MFKNAEGNITGAERGEDQVSPAESKTLSMHGNSLRGKREIPRAPTGVDILGGRQGKADGRNPCAHVRGKSHGCIVPGKPPNKDCAPGSAEVVEGRRPTKGNEPRQAALRTQSREGASTGLRRVREAARRDRRAQFTALLHHVTLELLERSFFALKRGAAPGVDGKTWKQYAEGLGEHLRDLHQRVQKGTYRAQPSKRVYIPKADGRMRPLGIAALEDKIVQQAVVTVLNEVYEEDFLGFSYGFRPGRSQHNALDALWVGLLRKQVNWVLDADIQGFFDNLSHEWLEELVAHRIGDPRIPRLIRKWLRAGVSEDGEWSKTEVGTPQGAVISPLLANIYLHYAFDQWAHQWRKRQAKGDCIIIRYADDIVVGFQHRHEAEQFLEDLRERMKKFGLSLHPEKTRLIEFGRKAEENRRGRGEGKPESFDFLGFTHSCGRTNLSGRFTVKRRTIAKRLRAKLQAVRLELMRHRHNPVPQTGAWLRSVVQGYFNYHAVPGNMPALEAFKRETERSWLHALRRRSQRHRMNWERFSQIVKRWVPRPRILHPWPDRRLVLATYPR